MGIHPTCFAVVEHGECTAVCLKREVKEDWQAVVSNVEWQPLRRHPQTRSRKSSQWPDWARLTNQWPQGELLFSSAKARQTILRPLPDSLITKSRGHRGERWMCSVVRQQQAID